MRRLAALALILATTASLAACGQKANLRPAAGDQLPAPPYGREERSSVGVLLEPPTQAIPERTVELRKRSEPREDDPFDLPPPE